MTMTTYVQLLKHSMSKEQKQQMHRADVHDDGLDRICSIDGFPSRNRETQRFMHLLDVDYFHDRIKPNGGDFYALPVDQFTHMQGLYFANHGEKPYLISYRGNHFTADIYIKAYPFIEFKNIHIGKDK